MPHPDLVASSLWCTAATVVATFFPDTGVITSPTRATFGSPDYPRVFPGLSACPCARHFPRRVPVAPLPLLPPLTCVVGYVATTYRLHGVLVTHFSSHLAPPHCHLSPAIIAPSVTFPALFSSFL